MNISEQLNSTTAALVVVFLLSTALVACGESDLVEVHDRELDEAIAQLEEPNAQAANPETDPVEMIVETLEPVKGAASEGQENPTPIDYAEYELVFSDEFNGSSIDPTKWNTALTWGPDFVLYNQLQYYVDIQNMPEFGYDPFSFDGEALTISAIETPENLRADANEQSWLSGVLTTADQFELTYGYLEAKVKLQQGRGLWPAFWLLSAEFEGLKPELFIMEYDGAKPDSVFHNYNFQNSNGELLSPGQQEVVRDGFSSDFHTVGVKWTEQELLFYIDGTPSYRIIGENIPRQDMYLVLNLAVGGIWPGAPDATSPRPASMTIDYVRAYQPIP